jgi:hypothetical protein
VQSDRSEVGTEFWVSAAFALAFILWGVLSPETFGVVTQAIFDWVVTNLGWFYLLAGNFFLVFVVILALSRYGKFRLGKDGERPEFSRFAWFAMLFQVGMGPALIFWGIDLYWEYTHGLAGLPERNQFHIRPSRTVRVRSPPRPRRERHQMARARPRERYLRYCLEPGDIQRARRRDHLRSGAADRGPSR